MDCWRSRTPPTSTAATCSPVTANWQPRSRWLRAAVSSTTATKGSARCRSATAVSSPSTTPARMCSSVFRKVTVRSSWVAALRTRAPEPSARAPLANPASWVADTYTVTFLTPASYEVRNSANVLVVAGAFTPTQSLTFAGVEVRIDGAPEAGDTFTVAPAAHATFLDPRPAHRRDRRRPSARRRACADARYDRPRFADLDHALAHLIDARGEIGARVRALDHRKGSTPTSPCT